MSTGRKTDLRRRGAGFTLLELVLVMVIVCTLLAAAAPALQGFFASRSTAEAAAHLVALASFARTSAVTEGRCYRLNIDVDAAEFWVTRQDGSAFNEPASEFGRTFSLPEGTDAEWRDSPEAARRGYVEFHPTGRTEAATLRLTGRRGRVYDVVCLSPTESFHVVRQPEDVE